MITLIFLLLVVFACGIVVGIGLRSDHIYRRRYGSSSDQVINEMRLQRAQDYVNNPVVRQMQEQDRSKY
jgi:hypothetical protein